MTRALAHEIDDEIERWLRKIVLALDLDRSTFWERASADLGFICTHWWGRPEAPKMPPNAVATRVSPWLTAKVLAGESLIYTGLDGQLPIEAPELRRFVEAYGPVANVTMPLQVGATVVGGLTFDKYRGPRDWPEQELRRLRVVGQIMASALDRKRADLQTRELQAEVTLAARRSAMGEFAASIAHELNQPLGAILGNANAARRMISGEKSNPGEAVAALGDIVEDAKRASGIIRRVRALFKDGNSPKTVLDLSVPLAEIEGLLRSEAGVRKLSLRIEVAPSLPPIMGDRIQLQQCLLNLVLNAFDSVAAANSQRREVLVRVVQEKAGWVRVSVSDSGHGIDPLVQGRLFEPFVTTKPNGMGMGLLVTRSIVESHGGKISGKSNDDVGATFSFTLPTSRGRLREERAEA
ncbi:MAG TPA: ATP-binding protein [Candidatus Binataceae bacterium]|nr:ATP-binding protein [Candidatus Binataceae bacterium]